MEILIIWFICGVISAAIASSKGRNVVGWFFGGFFLGLIGIVIIACLSNRKEEQQYRDHVDQENRRLREKLDQERIKAEALRQHVAGRLDLHDAHLGVDTRSFRASLSGPVDGQTKLPAFDEIDALFANNPSDNATVGEPSESADISQAIAPPPPTPKAKPAPRKWFFEQNGKSHGPVLEPEFVSMFQNGQLTGASLVWTESLSDWVAAKRVKLLQPHIQS